LYVADARNRDRLCIKIPTTSAGVQAAVILKKEGILTLGTAMFSVPQAIAASQAGMHAISPYFHRESPHHTPIVRLQLNLLFVRVACIAHTDVSYWIDATDPGFNHPMANRLYQIAQIYKRLAKETGKPQPQIKAAG
jgi:transaldolase